MSDLDCNPNFFSCTQQMECCGAVGPTWNSSIPPSCCPIRGPIQILEQFEQCSFETAYQDGCLIKMQNYVIGFLKSMAGLSLVFAVFEVNFTFHLFI